MVLPLIDPANLTEAQREVYDRVAAGGRGGVRGPFLAMLHAPELTGRLEQVGHYLRYEGVLPDRLRELAIMTLAAEWRCDVEWSSHHAHALGAGLTREVLAAIGASDVPAFGQELDALVFRFTRAAARREEVPAETRDALHAALGQAGLVELIAVVGYYTLLALLLTTFEVPGEGVAPPWKGGGAG